MTRPYAWKPRALAAEAEVKRLTEAADALSSREGGEGPEMVERVARALAARAGSASERASHLRFYQSYSGVPEYTELNWRHHLEDARDAIGAMREPTKAMERAGFEACDEYWDQGKHDGERTAQLHEWRAMIDAALSREGGEGVQHEPEVNHAKPLSTEAEGR